MKIVHFSDYPLSLAPYRLCQVQKEAGLDARLISYSDHYDPQHRFPCDILFEESLSLVCQLLEEAEIVHYHSSWKDTKLFETYPHLWDLVKKKPSVIQFHSYRFTHFEEALQEPSLIKLISSRSMSGGTRPSMTSRPYWDWVAGSYPS